MRKPRRGRRPDATGRTSGASRYVVLTHFLLDSIAFKSLRPNSVALLVQLARRFNGGNNGHIGLGVREAGSALNIKPATAGIAFRELADRGFIVLEQKATFDQKRLAREWRLTWLQTGPWDAPTARPTNDFMRWRPAAEKQKPVPIRATHSADSGHDPPGSDAQTAATVARIGTIKPGHSADRGYTYTYHGREPRRAVADPCQRPRSGRDDTSKPGDES